MMLLSEAAFALGVSHQGHNATFTHVGTDSRQVKEGELFIALRGLHFDAHQYLASAQANGAVAVMVDEQGQGSVPVGLPFVSVANTRQGLTQLAYAWRTRFTGSLVGITGSSGKTSVKEMLTLILQKSCGQKVLSTFGNLNNEIGVPLTLLRLRSEHRYAVVEMGMNHAGEIARLSSLARPDVALINNAGRAHIEHLGSQEAIARAKAEIYEGLHENAVAVINADDPFAALWQELAGKRKTLLFGLTPSAAVWATYELGEQQSLLRLRTPIGEAEMQLAVAGLHNVKNALAATAVAVALDLPLEVIAEGLRQYQGVKGRLQVQAALSGAKLIDDTYNANPESMRAAIDVLARIPGQRILIMGDMGELGQKAQACHAEVGEYAKASGIDHLYTLGLMAQQAGAAFGVGAEHFDQMTPLLEQVKKQLNPQSTVLVKGSRFMKMERVVEGLSPVKDIL